MLLNTSEKTLAANQHTNSSAQQLNNYFSGYPSGVFNLVNNNAQTPSNGAVNIQASASLTPSRMNSHMPDPYSSSLYIDALPAASRRRFAAAASERVLHAINDGIISNRSTSQVPGLIQQQNIARTPIRDRSADTKVMLCGRNRNGAVSSESITRGDVFANHQQKNNECRQILTTGSRDRSADAHGTLSHAYSDHRNNLKRYNLTENQQKQQAEKPPLGSNGVNSITQHNNSSAMSSTTICEVNRDHLKLEDFNDLSKKFKREGFIKARRSSLGSFSSSTEN